MKVSNIKDVDKFFEVVDSCNGWRTRRNRRFSRLARG